VAHDFKRQRTLRVSEMESLCLRQHSEENGFDFFFYKRQNGRKTTVSEAVRMVCEKKAGARAESRSVGGVNEVRGSLEAPVWPLIVEVITALVEVGSKALN